MVSRGALRSARRGIARRIGVVIVIAKGVGLLLLLMIVVAGIFVVLVLWWSSCRGSLVAKCDFEIGHSGALHHKW